VFVPMLMEPIRLLPEFAVTVNVTLPLPLPEAPPVIVIHGVAVVAVQEHPLADTATADPLPAVAGKDCEGGLIDVAHAPVCVTANVSPAMVRLPVRAVPVFAAAENATAPLPVPLVP
jgi:hypothetical protein